MARSILASLFLLHGAIGDRVSNAVAYIIALISARNLLAAVTVTLAFALLREATVGENRQRAVLSETLLRTGSSWDGEPYKSYLSGQPELTILKITLAPHTKLEWHSHPMPNAAYIIYGELTLERKEMEKSSILPLAKQFRRQSTHSTEESRETNPSYSSCSMLEFQARHSTHLRR